MREYYKKPKGISVNLRLTLVPWGTSEMANDYFCKIEYHVPNRNQKGEQNFSKIL